MASNSCANPAAPAPPTAGSAPPTAPCCPSDAQPPPPTPKAPQRNALDHRHKAPQPPHDPHPTLRRINTQTLVTRPRTERLLATPHLQAKRAPGGLQMPPSRGSPARVRRGPSSRSHHRLHQAGFGVPAREPTRRSRRGERGNRPGAALPTTFGWWRAGSLSADGAGAGRRVRSSPSRGKPGTWRRNPASLARKFSLECQGVAGEYRRAVAELGGGARSRVLRIPDQAAPMGDPRS